MRFEGNTLYVSKAEHVMIREHQQIQDAFGSMFDETSQVEGYIRAQLTTEEYERFSNINEINVQVEDESTEK
mgnify:CR=1 FL=1